MRKWYSAVADRVNEQRHSRPLLSARSGGPVTETLAGGCKHSETFHSRRESKTNMKAIQVNETGGPEVMELVELPVPEPKPSEAVVRIAAAGVNFIDVYNREGRYKLTTPFVLGQEGAGVVTAVGRDVESVKSGDRVAYSGVLGSYSEYSAVPADRLVKVPEGVDDRQAAAAMLQGMTAHYLCHDTYPVKKGEAALVHAASGGVGLLLVQMLHNLGARVIGTVSTDRKAKLAREAGADEIILYTQTDFETETKRLTAGKGLDVIYDSVGKSTFEKGLNLLRPRGMMVLFGGSSGAVPPFDPTMLSQKGSLFLTRPSLMHYILTSQELQARASSSSALNTPTRWRKPSKRIATWRAGKLAANCCCCRDEAPPQVLRREYFRT
jgi:NADPH:quinone reductase